MNISKHAKERYAERIMNRGEKLDINTYVAKNEEKIKADIEKMIQYGNVVYSGKSTKNPGTNVKLYTNGLWVVIVDTDHQTVVTLYRVDLGLGEDFDRDYMNRIVEQIIISEKEYEKEKEKCNNTMSEYQSIVLDNEKQIAEYKSLIKNLESLNASYKDVIASLRTNLNVSEQKVREKVMILTGKKIF